MAPIRSALIVSEGTRVLSSYLAIPPGYSADSNGPGLERIVRDTARRGSKRDDFSKGVPLHYDPAYNRPTTTERSPASKCDNQPPRF